MSDPNDAREKWTLEAVLCALVGVPWYAFSATVWGAIAVHIALAVVFVMIEVLIFGRGSAIMSFLLVLVFSVLIGMIAIGVNGGKLFG